MKLFLLLFKGKYFFVIIGKRKEHYPSKTINNVRVGRKQRVGKERRDEKDQREGFNLRLLEKRKIPNGLGSSPPPQLF